MKAGRWIASVVLVTIPFAAQAKEFAIYTFIPWRQHTENGGRLDNPPLADYLHSLGFRRVKVVYERDYFTHGVPDETKIRAVAQVAAESGAELVSFDNEFGDRFQPDTVIPRTLELVRLYRKYGHLPVGVYGTAPQTTYGWRPEKRQLTELLNARYQPVAEAVDVLSPVLYNYDRHDFEKWSNSARIQIGQSRIYGNKPIIPYISPYVEVATTVVPKGGVQVEELDGREMMARLDTLYRLGADGCIVWASSEAIGSDHRPLAFDGSRGWGRALVEFARAHRSAP